MEMDNRDDEAVTMYLREVATALPLSKEEQADLFRQLGTSGNWNERQEDMARRLIESQLALVVDVAKRHLQCRFLSLLELIQEGNIGLMKAVESFAEDPHGDFTAHASACIEAAITRAEAEVKSSKERGGLL